MTVPIPAWTTEGVLPPVDPLSPTSTKRSPYAVGLADLVPHFNTSPARAAILRGFLDHRRALHALGLVQGFQWLDGSFVENVEALETRSPRDIDVTTFFVLPERDTQEGLAQRDPTPFLPHLAKDAFHVDPYFVRLDARPVALVRLSAYWYSVWSHRRDQQWKGFLQVDLSPDEDAKARDHLDKRTANGGLP